MNNKMSLMHKVWYSNLNASQKTLLVYLISKANDEGKAWPTTVQLCQVMGMKHQKNFKGVSHYLPGLVETHKVGRKNVYTLNTPAIEGLLSMEVVVKETPHTPATADNHPSTEGVTEVNTPSTAGYTTLPQQGLIEQVKNNTTTKNKERTTTVPDGPVASPKDEQPSFGNREEPSLDYRELLESMDLDKDERESMRRWRKDRQTDEFIYSLLVDMREDAW